MVFCSGTSAVSIYGSVLHPLCLRRDLLAYAAVYGGFPFLRAVLWAQKRVRTFSRKGGSAPVRQSFSSPSAITRVRCFSQVSSIPCLPLSCRFFALSLPFTRRSCCLLSRHTSFIERLLILNPSRKISVFSNNVQRWISPVRFFQNPHDPINRPVLYFPWMPLS